MYRQAVVQRFTLLLLDEGEDYILDYNAFCESSMLPAKPKPGVRGKLRLCSKSVFFEPEDISIPLLRYASQ